MTDPRHNPDLDAAFGEPTASQPPLAQEQIDALTQALNDLTRKFEEAQRQPAGTQAGQQAGAMPWWFKYTPGKPDVPEGLPPWHHAYGMGQGVGVGSGGSGGWWNRYSDPNRQSMGPGGEQNPEDFAFVRSHWRSKRGPWGGKPRQKRADKKDKFNDLFEPPSVTAVRSPRWDKKRKPEPWFKQWTRRAGARARQAGGAAAGRSVQQGLGAAGQSLMWGGSMQYAARRAIAAGALAGGPAVAGVAVLGFVAAKAAESLNQMTREQVEFNRRLSNASASMAFVFAQRDVQERMRNREMGERLSQSASVLTQSEQFSKDQIKDTEVALNRLWNGILSLWEVAKLAIIPPMVRQVEYLDKIYQWLENSLDLGGRPLTMDEYAREAQQLDEEARKRKDPKWLPPKFR